MADTGEILQEAIDLEIFGNYFYNSLKSLVDSNEGKGLLTFLADAEQEHRQILEDLMVKTGGALKTSKVDEVVAQITKNEGIETVFNDLLGKSSLEKTDAIEAVKIGIDVEQKSIDFYTEHAETSDNDDVKRLFNELVVFENNHKETLAENLRNLQDEGVWYGYLPILEG